MNKPVEPTTASSKSAKGNTTGTESERIAEVIHDALDRFTVHAAEAEKRVKDAAGEARIKIKATKNDARRNAGEATHAVEDYVEEHPWAALGVAFGAGIVISALLRR